MSIFLFDEEETTGKINIEDLLGRKPIVLDEAKIKNELSGKVILISGAAGSIGSGIVRRVSNYSPAKLILLDQAESDLYDLQQELKESGCTTEVIEPLSFTPPMFTCPPHVHDT
jgi:FlaA1/EpsC-like NDP-sugar epimerase